MEGAVDEAASPVDPQRGLMDNLTVTRATLARALLKAVPIADLATTTPTGRSLRRWLRSVRCRSRRSTTRSRPAIACCGERVWTSHRGPAWNTACSKGTIIRGSAHGSVRTCVARVRHRKGQYGWHPGRPFPTARQLQQRGRGQAITGALVRTLGFAYFSYGVPSHANDWERPNDKGMLLTTYPTGWQSLYRRRGYHAEDAVILHAREALRPFKWGDAAHLRSLKPGARSLRPGSTASTAASRSRCTGRAT